jgi:hypothetical protein
MLNTFALIIIGIDIVFNVMLMHMNRKLRAMRRKLMAPVNMTPSKLRYIAEILDMYDGVAIRNIMALREHAPERLANIDMNHLGRLTSTEIQDDLRGWADEMDKAMGPA